MLITGHGFQVLPSGEVSQDREVVFRAQMAIDGIFKYLSLYESAGGDAPLIAYFRSRYGVPQARLESATETAAHAHIEVVSELASEADE